MSLMVFAFGQVLMDLEVVARVLMGVRPLHGFTNKALGATVVLLPTVLLGRPICQAVLRVWNSRLSPAQTQWLSVDPSIPWQAAWGGGLLGIYSHVFLDAIMHADARPWAPFSSRNPFVGLLGIGTLNALCLGTMVVGFAALALVGVWKRRG